MSTLHVTNGDSAVDRLRAAGIEGDIVPWRDVLHEGPVPDGDDATLRAARATFIAARGWATHEAVLADLEARDARLAQAVEDADEVVLWFEHDLYDQLQLAQAITQADVRREAATARLSVVHAGDYLGLAEPAWLQARFAARERLTAAALDTGRAAWSALRAPTPRGLAAMRGDAAAPLPFLDAALQRLLEEYPDARTGLSRSERQALEAIEGGATTPRTAFPASHHAREAAIFLGDTTFAWHLERLSTCRVPLVTFADGTRIGQPLADDGAWWDRALEVTAAGERVLAGLEDHVPLNGVERWIGGVRLDGGSPWRWDATAGVLR